MSGQSAIEWTDATWNPITGCTRVSPGCARCYIERTPPFRMEGRRFELVDGESTTGMVLHPERLERPLHWRKPRRVFVNSLSDLFHEEVPDYFIDRVFAAMALAPQHVFQVLTKRPERAREWFRGDRVSPREERVSEACGDAFGWEEAWPDERPFDDWPLPNVWLGVSVENARFAWRADVLREIPAAVGFISAEPLLGSLFSTPAERDPMRRDGDAEPPHRLTVAAGEEGSEAARAAEGRAEDATASEARPTRRPLDLTGIDWVIVGGESGPGARPMHPDWAREIRDACLAPCLPCRSGFKPSSFSSGTVDPTHWSPGALEDIHSRRPAFFFKQWGEYAPIIGHLDDQASVYAIDDLGRAEPWVSFRDGSITMYGEQARDGRGRILMRKLGKKRAGRLLDGRTWDEFPASAAVAN